MPQNPTARSSDLAELFVPPLGAFVARTDKPCSALDPQIALEVRQQHAETS